MRQERVWRSRLRRTVIVQLKSGVSFEGVLFEAYPEALVLRNAVAHEHGPKGEPAPVDGEVVLLRQDVAFIQVS